jgi:hypothetical protein
MVARSLELYKIAHGENPVFRIPFLKYRGTPTGIDVHKVVAKGILPQMNIGIAGVGGGQIGAGTVRARSISLLRQQSGSAASRRNIRNDKQCPWGWLRRCIVQSRQATGEGKA